MYSVRKVGMVRDACWWTASLIRLVWKVANTNLHFQCQPRSREISSEMGLGWNQ